VLIDAGASLLDPETFDDLASPDSHDVRRFGTGAARQLAGLPAEQIDRIEVAQVLDQDFVHMALELQVATSALHGAGNDRALVSGFGRNGDTGGAVGRGVRLAGHRDILGFG
jgi:hypothetical protein